MDTIFDSYYTGPERRIASKPRRINQCRRHRKRTEALVSDCRALSSRRNEDEEGFTELLNQTDNGATTQPQPQITK